MGTSEITDPTFGNGLDFAYKESDKSYTTGSARFSFTFLPSDKDPASSDPINYRASRNSYIALLQLFAKGADYARLAGIYGAQPNASYRCILGDPTQSGDLPTQNKTYSVLVADGLGTIEGQNYEFSKSTADLSYDSSTKRLAITINLRGTKNDGSSDTNVYSLGTLATDSPIALSGSTFNGAIYSATPERFAGVVGGSLFGPQGGEAGLVLRISGRTSTGVEYGLHMGLLAKAN